MGFLKFYFNNNIAIAKRKYKFLPFNVPCCSIGRDVYTDTDTAACISVPYFPEAIGWVEGSFYNVLSRREGWRGRVENWFGRRAGRKRGEEGEEKENMGLSTISEKNIYSLSIIALR